MISASHTPDANMDIVMDHHGSAFVIQIGAAYFAIKVKFSMQNIFLRLRSVNHWKVTFPQHKSYLTF